MKRLSISLSDENIEKILKAKKVFNEKTFSKALNKFIEHPEVKL